MTDKHKLYLTMQIGLFGLKDLRKLGPIGDLGYANGWYGPFGGTGWMKGLMERAITNAASEQGFHFTYKDNSFHRGTDNEYRCEEILLIYHVDSSD